MRQVTLASFSQRFQGLKVQTQFERYEADQQAPVNHRCVTSVRCRIDDGGQGITVTPVGRRVEVYRHSFRWSCVLQ